jgi:hypothetical protein
VRRAGGQPLERLLLAHRADATRHTLAARLVAEELRDPQQCGHQFGLLVVDDHNTGAERDAGRPRVLVRQLQVEQLRADERARSAPEQHRLGRRRSREVEQLAERRAERQLVQSGPVDAAGDAEEPGAGRAFRPCERVPRAAVSQHLEHVEERLDVVHGGGLAEEAHFDRERRLVARLAAVALDRLEEGGLLAAHVRPGADAQFDLEPV